MIDKAIHNQTDELSQIAAQPFNKECRKTNNIKGSGNNRRKSRYPLDAKRRPVDRTRFANKYVPPDLGKAVDSSAKFRAVM